MYNHQIIGLFIKYYRFLLINTYLWSQDTEDAGTLKPMKGLITARSLGGNNEEIPAILEFE